MFLIMLLIQKERRRERRKEFANSCDPHFAPFLPPLTFPYLSLARARKERERERERERRVFLSFSPKDAPALITSPLEPSPFSHQHSLSSFLFLSSESGFRALEFRESELNFNWSQDKGERKCGKGEEVLQNAFSVCTFLHSC